MNGVSIRLVVFIAATCGLLFVSWKSLRVPGSHGFYRFFGWEAIVALVLVNFPRWFVDPLSVLQLLSWISLAASLVMLVQGAYLLLVTGKPSKHRQDATLFDFEKTSTLVTSSVYKYIRHPLYGSLLFLAWGALLKDVTWYSVCLVVVATVCLVTTAKADEKECIRYFGPPYKEYMTRSKMFIPLIW